VFPLLLHIRAYSQYVTTKPENFIITISLKCHDTLFSPLPTSYTFTDKHSVTSNRITFDVKHLKEL